jgi:superfamily II DNA/RNA helicase
MATATLTKAVKSLLSDVEGNKFDIEFSDPENKTPKKLSPRATLEMKIIEVDGVHRTLPHVKHIFEETKGMDKLIVLKSLLERSSNKVQDGGMGRTLIFCNTISSCRAVEYAVNEYNTALAYHGDMPSDERSNNLLKFRNGEVNILIGTDIAARGLDIPEIDHVILFDFPMNSVDYIHRAGRCGRAGRKGKVILNYLFFSFK